MPTLSNSTYSLRSDRKYLKQYFVNSYSYKITIKETAFVYEPNGVYFHKPNIIGLIVGQSMNSDGQTTHVLGRR
mgnify:CR=1 FL=1